MSKRIINIGKYKIIRVGRRFGASFSTINMQRRKFGFDVFVDSTYVGHKEIAEAYYYLMRAYVDGYKTLERVLL